MKRVLALPAVVLMLCAFTSISGVEMPTQKPGLWKVTMTGSSVPGGARSYMMCQDAASIASGKASADAHLKNDCSRNELHKVGSTFTADMECTMSGMHIVSHSVTTVHGDDSFHSEITSTVGKDHSVMTVDNQWLGACKPGQKVGVPTT
jgi:hypothetical protein